MESLIPIWVTSVATGIGVMYAIIRNGSRAKKQDETLKSELKAELNHIKDKLDDPHSGLGSIRKAVADQRLYCTKTSTDIRGQVDNNTKEIDTLRRKKR